MKIKIQDLIIIKLDYETKNKKENQLIYEENSDYKNSLWTILIIKIK